MNALWWRVSAALRTPGEPALPLTDALEALGDSGHTQTYADEVPVEDVVGSVSRTDDFDADMPLRNPQLRRRWEATRERFRSGSYPPPVDLVRLGDLYFVYDGHHRVSVARSMGWTHLPARVSHRCTVAFAMCCLRVADLSSKRAETQFLRRVQVPDEVSRDFWLDDPADWGRLAEDAADWAAAHPDRLGESPDAHALGGAWWDQRVRPAVEQARREGADTSLADVQLFVTVMAARDHVEAFGAAGGAADSCC